VSWGQLGVLATPYYLSIGLVLQGRYDCPAPVPPDREALKAGTTAAPAAPDGEVSTNNIEQVIAMSFISNMKINLYIFQTNAKEINFPSEHRIR
jgi:hypothetical protein